MPTILNPDLYQMATEIANETYRKPSAYKSGFIVKKYKELGGQYGDDSKPKNLKRWFEEDWQDIAKIGYPVYRPTKRINAHTPLTASEIDPSNFLEQALLKQEIRGESNLPPFKKKGDSIVQSIIFKKDNFTLPQAREWLAKNGYKTEVDEKENTYRFRQEDPEEVKRSGFKHYITKPLGNSGIELVIGYKKLTGGKLKAAEIKEMLRTTYHPESPPQFSGDWVVDPELSSDYAKVYYSPSTGKAAVAHRGTQGASDWINNLAYATGTYELTDRFKEGKRVQEAAERKYGKQNISTLGHSQGAVLARKLGSDTKEVINVNPAYLFEKPKKNEFNIRSSSDIVSGLYAPVAKARKILYPKYSTERDITVESKNPFDIKGEHSTGILERLGEQEIGTGAGYSTLRNRRRRGIFDSTGFF
jgi:hypothetical protein